jgi:starch-binding outer membrane protein, SusD/RagB family
MKLKIFFFIAIGMALNGCSDSFLEVPIQGALTEEALQNKKGVDALLIGAYASVIGPSGGDNWYDSAPTNWIWGDITSGDAHRGGDSPSDNPEGILAEEFKLTPNSTYVLGKWVTVFGGISRANAVIRTARNASDMTDDEKTKAIAQARFLRGHFNFEGTKMWEKIPYIDENVTDYKLSNDSTIWEHIDADFKYAYENLPEIQSEVGRVNKWAAACYLAKSYMFQHRYTEALSLLNTIVAQGTTSSGEAYGLNTNYHDNFNVEKENSKECVFAVQFSVNDGSYGYHSNIGEWTNYPYMYAGSYGGGWKQPSQDLVDAFKTDDNGLPMLDSYYVSHVTSDYHIASYDPFTPYQGNLDPRIDWSLGRRGIPYLDWGVHPGQDWLVGGASCIGGPYSPMKNVYQQSQWYNSAYWEYANWWMSCSALNYNIIRYADVLLWAAECEVEVGTLDNARKYVNQIRERAQNSDYVTSDAGEMAANYKIELYTSSWTDQDYARDAVRFERRLELSLEGHRFFDLVRWGIAANYINEYLNRESSSITMLNGISFTKGKNEYYPIPQTEIDFSAVNGVPKLKQNPGYN